MPTRTFIAIELPGAAREAMAERSTRLRRLLPQVRFLPPESIHLTLAFLGDLDEEQLDRAQAATRVAAEAGRPLTLAVDGLGTFGPPRAPRILWVGVGGQVSGLVRLQAGLAGELAARGFPREERPFSPHLTLARFKQPLDPAALQRLIAHLGATQPADTPFAVDALSVMKSELLRTGAQYTCLLTFELGGKR